MDDVFKHKKYGIIRESRPAQLQMAQDVWNLLERVDSGTLWAEGGTGTGKSFAYLIPALLKIQDQILSEGKSGRRLVIATAKKILQDQLARDIPMLLKKLHLESTASWGIMKGRSNYACWRAVRDVPEKDRRQFQLFVDECRQRRQPADKNQWIGLAPDWWDDVCIENCLSNKSCPDFAHCQPHPQEWNVVITNHHILAYDLARGPGSLFGPYSALVIDEAHNAIGAFRGAFSKELRERTFEALLKKLSKDDNLRGCIDDSGVVSALRYRQQIESNGRDFIKLYHAALARADKNRQINPDEIIQDLKNFAAAIGDTIERTRDITVGIIATGLGDEFNRAMASRMQKFNRRLTSIQEFVTALLAFNEINYTNFVVTAEEKAILIQPVELGPIVGPELMKIPKKVITSATLAMSDERGAPSFDFQQEQFGILRGPETLTGVYPSPFDYDNHAVLYAPYDMPLPPKPDDPPEERNTWINKMGAEIARLCELVNGDTFVLFSAKKDMLDVYAVTRVLLRTANIPIILHEGDAAAIKQKYDETPHSVLFGLKSFWEGIDIPGDKLRQVIITKLPFPHPFDPIVAALNRKYNDFNRISVPPMVYDVKQGAGRLIRCNTDRGFVSILDPRIWTGGAGGKERQLGHLRSLAANPCFRPLSYGKRLFSSLGLNKVVYDFTTLQTYANHFFRRVNNNP
jgi:ATP-dependent DNA helicase DinG